MINYDGTNRNARGIMVQMVYGENGINQSIQTDIQLNILGMDNKAIETKLGFSSEQLKKLSKLKLSDKVLKNFNEKYITKEYLYFILKSEAFLDFADKQSRRANIPKINMNEMSGFEFPIPPMAVQRTFMNQIEITDGILAINVEASNKSSNLFQTLLQKAFKGELVS
jgi:hypothetical protein